MEKKEEESHAGMNASKHGVTCGCAIRFCLEGSWCFDRGGAGACAGFVCQVDDGNNRVSSSFVAHRIRAKLEIVGVVPFIRCMTLCLPHGIMHDLLYPHVLKD